MNRQQGGVATTLGFGVGFLLAGMALLLQELDMFSLRWTFVLPVIIAIVGLVVLASGLIGAHREPRSTTVDSSH